MGNNTGQPPLTAGGPSHHQYGKPRAAGPNRYPPGGNPNPTVGGGGYYPDRSAGQGGVGFSGGPYPPQPRAPGVSGPRGSSGGYAPPNYTQNVPYGGGSGAGGGGGGGRGPNVGGNRSQPYSWQQQ